MNLSDSCEWFHDIFNFQGIHPWYVIEEEGIHGWLILVVELNWIQECGSETIRRHERFAYRGNRSVSIFSDELLDNLDRQYQVQK